jgi:hypothetical protein
MDVSGATEETHENQLGDRVRINSPRTSLNELNNHIDLSIAYTRKFAIPTPNVILDHTGDNDSNAGEATVLPM